jgi:hypothetical protein
VLFFASLLMIVFRQKYPRWWFDWDLKLTRFSGRVAAYILLLGDEFPSADEEKAVHFDLRYPDVERNLNQRLPLVKGVLAFPHYIVLWMVVVVAVLLAWFATLFTGRYPAGLFDFVAGVIAGLSGFKGTRGFLSPTTTLSSAWTPKDPALHFPTHQLQATIRLRGEPRRDRPHRWEGGPHGSTGQRHSSRLQGEHESRRG